MSCLDAKPTASPDEIIVSYQRIMTKIITDNYSVIFVYFVITILLILIAYYFFKNIRRTLKSYRKNSALIELTPAHDNNVKDPAADNEKYTKHDTSKDATLYALRSRDNPIDYIDKGKKDFLSDVDDKYDEYNVAKSDYIKTTYARKSDDVVDQDILFSRHDDYEYKRKRDD